MENIQEASSIHKRQKTQNGWKLFLEDSIKKTKAADPSATIYIPKISKAAKTEWANNDGLRDEYMRKAKDERDVYKRVAEEKGLKKDKKPKAQGLLKTRCSPSSIAAIMKYLKEDSTKMNVIEKMGFGRLQYLPNRTLNLVLLKEIVNRFEPDSCSIDGVKITAEDVGKVLGIPSRGLPIPKDALSDEELSSFKNKFGGLSITKLKQKMNSPEVVDANFEGAFLLLILSSFLCPSVKDKPTQKLYEALSIASDASKYNWADYVLQWLVNGVRDYKKKGKPKAGIQGCIFFLEIFYLNQVYPQPVDGDKPLMFGWTSERMKSALNFERKDKCAETKPYCDKSIQEIATLLHIVDDEIAKLKLERASVPAGQPSSTQNAPSPTCQDNYMAQASKYASEATLQGRESDQGYSGKDHIDREAEVTICQVCGDKGFSVALIFCDKCELVAEHRYCLKKMPPTFTEYVTWFCEDCAPPNIVESSSNNEIPIASRNTDKIAKPSTPSNAINKGERPRPQLAEENINSSVTKTKVLNREMRSLQVCETDNDDTTIPGGKRLRPRSKLGKFVKKSTQAPVTRKRVQGHSTSPVEACETSKSVNHKSDQKAHKRRKLTPEDTAKVDEKTESNKSDKVSKKIEHSKINTDQNAKQAESSKNNQKLEKVVEACKRSNSENHKSDQKAPKRRKLTMEDTTKVDQRPESKKSNKNIKKVERSKMNTDQKSEQAESSKNSNDQKLEVVESNKNKFKEVESSKGSLDRISKKQHTAVVGYKANTDQEADSSTKNVTDESPSNSDPSIDLPAQPIVDPVWRGRFSIADAEYESMDGLAAHLSTKACEKVCDEARLLPGLLSADMLPRADVWPKSFRNSDPGDGHIALYFFPENERDERVFDDLVGYMIDGDLAMRAEAVNAELLIFTSIQLPLAYWRFQAKYYLWGVFRRKQASVSQQQGQVTVHTSCNDSAITAQ